MDNRGVTRAPLGIKLDVLKDSKSNPKEDKNQGRKSTKQIIQDIESYMMDL